MGQPEQVFILHLLFQYSVENLFINGHEEVFNIQMDRIEPLSSIFAASSDKVPHPLHRLMQSLILSAGVGVMDKDGLIHGFKPFDEQMMHHSVPEISGNDLPHLGSFEDKADSARGLIGPVRELLRELKEVLLCVHLKFQGVEGVSLVLPAFEITPVEVLKRE